MNRKRHQTGFSLIELSVVLIIIGILLSMTIPALSPQIKRAAEKRARNLLDANVDSLVGFAAGSRSLPTTTTYKNYLRSITDGFSDTSEFQYLYDGRLDETDGICDYSSTYITVLDCGTRDAAACDDTTNYDGKTSDVAFVLVSAGNDGNNQTVATAELAAATVVKTYRYDNTGEDGETTVATASASDPYDDYVGWATLAELKANAGCGRGLQIITDNTLPNCSDTSCTNWPVSGSNHYVSLIATDGRPITGGTGTYRWCLDDEWSLASVNLQIDTNGGSGAATNLSEYDCAGSPTWTSGNTAQLVATGSISPSGTYPFRLYVQDDTGTTTYKDFSVSIP